MIDYRNILRLHSEGHSQRAMERELYCSRHTISDVLDKAKKAGISWPLGEDVTNEMIQELLYPGKYALACPYTQPDFQGSRFGRNPIYVHAVLREVSPLGTRYESDHAHHT